MFYWLLILTRPSPLLLMQVTTNKISKFVLFCLQIDLFLAVFTQTSYQTFLMNQSIFWQGLIIFVKNIWRFFPSNFIQFVLLYSLFKLRKSSRQPFKHSNLDNLLFCQHWNTFNLDRSKDSNKKKLLAATNMIF